MKNVLLVLTLVTGSLAFAESSTVKNDCYQAINPQNITVESFKINPLDDISRIDLSEPGKKASLIMETFRNEYSSTGFSQNAIINVKTQSLKASTSAYNAAETNVYSIDCDGGRVTLTEEGNNLVANTDYLRAEVSSANSEECSGDGILKMKDVVFKKISCKK